MRTTFAVGRLTSDATEIVVVPRRRTVAAPFPGPWTLRARFGGRPGGSRETAAPSDDREDRAATVH